MKTRLGQLLLASGFWLLASAPPARLWNTYPIAFAEGQGELEWISESSFRLARSWDGPLPVRKPITPDAVKVTARDAGTTLLFETKYLKVEVEKAGGRISVTPNLGAALAGAFTRGGASVAVEFASGAAERFYGLGARGAARLDLRGGVIQTRTPFLISSNGYGEYYRGAEKYEFDLASAKPGARHVTIPGGTVEYFFYYGPTPKEIYEEHLKVTGDPGEFDAGEYALRAPKPEALALPSWAALADAVRHLQHAALSADLMPKFDFARFEHAPALLAARAAQIASLLPGVYAAQLPPSAAEFRERLIPYFLSYGFEARTRGIPFIHSMPVQFPEDPAAANRTDEFLVGDELLIVPVLNAGNTAKPYLPAGLWTDLATGLVYKGRQEVALQVPPGRLPVFAKNGSIVPLGPAAAGGAMELHYFPKLAAEFFLYEPGEDDISQFHAAPAGDAMRLEVESRVARDYQWVVHHTGAPASVETGGAALGRVPDLKSLTAGAWYYDPAGRRLHLRLHAAPAGDHVVYISF